MIGNFHPELPFPAKLFAPCTNQALAKDVRRDSLSEAVEGSIKDRYQHRCMCRGALRMVVHIENWMLTEKIC